VARRDPFERRVAVLSQYREPRALLERREALRQQKRKQKPA
jgi:hypothetical protein